MRPPAKAIDEFKRQTAVDDLHLEGEDVDKTLELVTHLVTNELKVPISAFSVLDHDREVFKCSQGLDLKEAHRDVSFCGHTILQDGVLEVRDARYHETFHDNPYVTGYPHIRFYAGVPVRAPNQQPIGSLFAVDRRPRNLSPVRRQTMLDLKGILEALLTLLSLSVRDHLTGLYNRRNFDEVIDREWRRACRLALPISLLAIDIDYFKPYNDVYGHQAGDSCLRSLATTLRAECKRSGDLPFRTGGEEFAVLLTGTSGEQEALALARRLKDAIRALRIPHQNSPLGVVTVSIGLAIAEVVPRDGSGFEEFILCSDSALYAAKARSRDNVVLRRFTHRPARTRK